MTDQMILGDGCAYSMDPEITGLNNNVLVCGGPGSGKTMSISEPLLLNTYEHSLIVTATKRRIVDRYAGVFKSRGYHVLEMNFATPGSGETGYDPLQFITSYQDITCLAESIVLAKRNGIVNQKDPYWDNAAVSLLSAEIALTFIDKGEGATMADVLELNSRLHICDRGEQIGTAIDESIETMRKQSPGCFALSCWDSFGQLPIRTASCVYSSLNTTLDTLFNPEIREVFRRPRQVDFEELANRKTVLFLITNPVNASLNSLVNIFYGQAFKQLFEYAESLPDGVLPVPVHVLCDDFGTGCPIPNFSNYISIFREKGISVTMLLQSESQLNHLYGQENAATIINGCDSYVYLGGMDLITAKSISQRIDKPLEEVLSLPVGREYVFRRGQRPVVTRRYPVTEHPLYQAMEQKAGRRNRRSEPWTIS